MKLFVAVLISLCLPFSNAQIGPGPVQEDLCECDLDVINTQISAAFPDQPSK